MSTVSELFVHPIAVTVLFFVAVLFGVNPISQFWGTLLWAVIISTLLLLPSQLLLPNNGHHWLILMLQSRSPNTRLERWLGYGSLMTLLGAWLGAFPILLDWNRPWQVWPIPSCVGAIGSSLLWYIGCASHHYFCHWKRKHSFI